MSEKCPNPECRQGLVRNYKLTDKIREPKICPTCHGTGAVPHEASYSSEPSKPYTCPECGGTFTGQHFCVGKSIPYEEVISSTAKPSITSESISTPLKIAAAYGAKPERVKSLGQIAFEENRAWDIRKGFNNISDRTWNLMGDHGKEYWNGIAQAVASEAIRRQKSEAPYRGFLDDIIDADLAKCDEEKALKEKL